MSIVKRYAFRFGKWAAYATGRSYQHVQQGRGKAFAPGRLEGYFNDLTGKVGGPGRLSAAGVPLVETDTTPEYEMPIVVFQWGLGNWDAWLLSGKTDAAHAANVLATARWAVATMTADGGWDCWTSLSRPVISPYSAMAQGEGISVLVRAGQIEDDPAFLRTAQRAADFMLNSGAHGLTRPYNGGISLEEYPGDAMEGVLNGWIFALVGLSDLAIATGDESLRETTERLAGDLAAAMPAYDMGYWSLYDRSGIVASPAYHSVHIAQLEALAEIFPRQAEALNGIAARFRRYEASKFGMARAFVKKLGQKLVATQQGEMRESSARDR